MKKILLIFLLFMGRESLFCHAPEGMFFSLLPFGYSMNISNGNQINKEINMGLFGVINENQNTGIGVECKFPQYFFLFSRHMFNFIYLSSYWNIFSITHFNNPISDYSMMVGPFVSINYLNWYTNDSFKLSDYILDLFDNPVGCLTSPAKYRSKTRYFAFFYRKLF